MIAAILAAEGRPPVHNRAGSNMTWGVATALLEQRGAEGLFEVDEAWLPRVAQQLHPRLIVLGNLFRDQLDRYGEMEALAEEWAKAVAARARRDRPGAERRRPADRRPRPRPRHRAPPRGRPLLRDRGPLAGAAGAAARLRRQALPPLRAPLRLRGRLRRPPRPLLVPELRRRSGRGPTSRRRGSSCAGWRARRRRCGSPAARSRSSSPSPASTTSTTRWRRSPRRSGSGSTPERIAAALRDMRAAFGRVETIAVGGGQRLDPADQEPGRRQRGPAHAARSRPSGRERGGSTSGSR